MAEIVKPVQKLLIPQGIITIPAFTMNVEEFFFGGKSGICIITSQILRDLILKYASKEVSCNQHQKKNFRLSQDLSDTEIQAGLEQKVYQTLDQYLASTGSRIKLLIDGGDHELLTNGYCNVEYVNVGDRVVRIWFYLVSYCWFWICNERCNLYSEDSQFSSLV